MYLLFCCVFVWNNDTIMNYLLLALFIVFTHKIYIVLKAMFIVVKLYSTDKPVSELATILD